MNERDLLIVSGQPDVLSLLQTSCSQVGFKVRASPDGLHATHCAMHRPPDFLLMDEHIGGIDPLMLCEQFRKDRRTSSILIVLMVDAVYQRCIQLCRAQGLLLFVKRADYSQAAAGMLHQLATDSYSSHWGVADKANWDQTPSWRLNPSPLFAGARVYPQGAGLYSS